MIPRRIVIVTLLMAGLTAACSGGDVPDTAVDQETFVRTYVMLRMTALSSPSGEITEADRDRILAGEGITADELEEFARVRGDDPAAMRAVWDEVERRLKVAAGELPPDPQPEASGEASSGGV